MVHPPLELVHLGGLAHPAEDHRLGEGQVLAVGVEVLVNLNGQLPGGGENQGPDRSPPSPLGQPLQNGHAESTGLSRAGLGAASTSRPAMPAGMAFSWITVGSAYP